MNFENKLKIYFIGIGGVGVSAICKYLLNLGFYCAGSDKTEGVYVSELRTLSVPVYIGEFPENIPYYDIIIYSSAINENNLELKKAKELRKVIYSRAEVLQMIISRVKYSVGIAGSHGKTTSTAMLTNCLNGLNLNPTSIIGGNDKKYKNLLFGENKYGAFEVCEYKKNINFITPYVSVVLNTDPDHLDAYGSDKELYGSYENFLNRATQKVICLDDNILKNYKSNNLITYGFNEKSNYFGKDLKSDNGKYSFTLIVNGKKNSRVNLSILGKHNIYNALSVIAVLNGVFGFKVNDFIKYIEEFTNVERRFEYLGNIKNKKIYADYSHHPNEIKAVIETVKEVFKNDYFLIFEPHTYTRTKNLFSEFVNVLKGENLALYKTFSAREEYFYEGSSNRLAKEINCDYYEDFHVLINLSSNQNAQNIVVLGAGELYGKLKEYIKKEKH